MAATLTIFTPAYNRADLLPRAFHALCAQKNKDFVWLIIDDGSTDNTAQVVESFQNQDAGFEIRYFRKENGGLHTAYNAAIELADTELSMCIDSDDWIAEDAVEKIISLWREVRRPDCAGILALDAMPDGTPTCHIDAEGYINMNQYNLTHAWGGDRKLVVRTDLYKSVAPMPSFAGEKNFNPQYMHIRIAENYEFYVMNEVLCYVDYQDAGMSASIFRQYMNSPNSFAEYRRMKMTVKQNTLKNIVRNAIHYDSSCILAGKPLEIVTRSPRKAITLMVAPIGWLLSWYIRYKQKER